MSQRVTKSNNNYQHPSYDPIVSSQAMEFWQNDTDFVAVRGLPVIRVPAESGKLAIVSQADINRPAIGKRSSEHSEAPIASLGVSTVDYTTDGQSLEFVLSASDAAKLGYKFGMNVPQIIPRALGQQANIHTEMRLASKMASASWYRTVSGAGSDSGAEGTTTMNRAYWSDKTKDPVPGIRAEVGIQHLRSGKRPTALRCGYKAFEALATNPFVRSQILGASVAAVMQLPIATEAQLSALLGLRVMCSSGIYNTAAEGLDAVNARCITSEDALLTYDADGLDVTATMGDTGPTVNLNGQATGFARVVYEGVAANGFQIRNTDAPRIGMGGSTTWILDLYQGMLIVDPKMGTFFDGIAQ